MFSQRRNNNEENQQMNELKLEEIYFNEQFYLFLSSFILDEMNGVWNNLTNWMWESKINFSLFD